MESVDASNSEARSMYLEGSLGGPWWLTCLWNLLEEFSTELCGNSNTTVAGDPNEESGLLN